MYIVSTKGAAMELIQSILLVASLLLLGYIAIFTLFRTRIPGASELFLMVVATIVWTFGSLMELLVTAYDDLVFWRNIQQIGVFLTPLSTLLFSVAYTMNRPMRYFSYFAAVVEALAVILIFTDSSHHLMRVSVEFVHTAAYGNEIVVHSTPLGTLFVGFNFLLAPLSVLLLALFARKVAPNLRKQLRLIMASILFVFAASLLKSVLLERLGVYLQMSVLNAPSVALFCYALFRHEFLYLSPVARNKVFDVIDQGIVVTDKNGTIVDFNGKASQLFEALSPERTLKAGTAAGTLIARLNNIGPARPTIDFGGEFQKASGDGYVSISQHVLEDKKSHPLGYVLVLTDITAQREYEQHLKKRAELDHLTGVYNREGLCRAFPVLYQKIRKDDAAFSLMMLDIDHFKGINDLYGHLGGDRVLEHLAQTARSVLHGEVILARLGGDEFLAVLPNTRCNEALQAAERLRRKIEKERILYEEHHILYTISIGVAGRPSSGRCLGDLVRSADIALYRAKADGGNTASLHFTEQPAS
jgi:diguanylate cyclase (GGDEF)-like protein